jgi:hypothetical protein
MDKPTTLDECMQSFSEMWSAEDRAEFQRMSRHDLIMLHHGLGQWIRNNWELWKGGALQDHMKGLGFVHADDMSQAIITEYWNRLNSKPSEIEKQVQEYAEYWDKHGGVK